MQSNMKAKLTAEFIGTFWLVLGGCGSAVLAALKEQGVYKDPATNGGLSGS